MKQLHLVGGIFADAPAPQHMNFGQGLFGAEGASASLLSRGANTARTDGRMRSNDPTPQAEQSRTNPWHLAPRRSWSRPSWQLLPFLAASVRPTQKRCTTSRRRFTPTDRIKAGWL